VVLGLGHRTIRRRPSESDEVAALEALREVIVGPVHVAAVLPDAVAEASRRRSRELGAALEPAMTRAVRDVARREPAMFGEILAPTIGTAVRRAVADAVAAMLQRLNEALDHSFTLRGLSWRLEARRSGRAMSEIVLAHTLVYRVEWVMLIDTERSLMLEEVSLPEVGAKAPDQVSAMLSAIQAFVSEAFQPTAPGGALRTVEVGDITLWIDHDPQLTVAAAVRGIAPRELREMLYATRQSIHTEHASALVDLHSSDRTSSFAAARPLLEDCLRCVVKPTPRRAQRLLAIVGIVGLTAAAVLSLRACETSRADASLQRTYRQLLEDRPGIAVLSIARDDGGHRISALVDPRSPSLSTLTALTHVLPLTLETRPFRSSDPRLGPPLAAVDAAIHELETLQFEFARGASTVAPTEVARAAELFERVRAASALHGMQPCVDAIGYSDETGSAVRNAGLRAQRAQNVAEALVAAGVPRGLVSSRPATTSADGTRAVRLRASLRPLAHVREECGA